MSKKIENKKKYENLSKLKKKIVKIIKKIGNLYSQLNVQSYSCC